MFINMLTPSISNINEVNSQSVMFEGGAKVGDYGKYINTIPYTGNSVFNTNDWFIIEMNS
jgi:hypothetical protein